MARSLFPVFHRPTRCCPYHSGNRRLCRIPRVRRLQTVQQRLSPLKRTSEIIFDTAVPQRIRERLNDYYSTSAAGKHRTIVLFFFSNRPRFYPFGVVDVFGNCSVTTPSGGRVYLSPRIVFDDSTTDGVPRAFGAFR